MEVSGAKGQERVGLLLKAAASWEPASLAQLLEEPKQSGSVGPPPAAWSSRQPRQGLLSG